MDEKRQDNFSNSDTKRPSQVPDIEALFKDVERDIHEIREKKLIADEFLDRIQGRLEFLKRKCSNLQAIENDVEAIREELLDPVKKEIGKGKQFSVLGLWVGAIGSAVSISALLVSVVLTQSTSVSVQQSVEGLKQQTRYLGAFPKNMPEIIRLMNETDESFEVAADHAAYGFFSAAREFDDYSALMKKLAVDDKKTVSIRCYGIEQNRGQIEQQFAKSSKNSPQRIANSEAGKRYKELHPQEWEELDNAPNMTAAIEWFVKRERGFVDELEELGLFPAYFEEDETPPVYAWIRDGEEAVFSFDGIVGEEEEVAFLTEDPALIDVLKAVARSADARPVLPESFGGGPTGPAAVQSLYRALLDAHLEAKPAHPSESAPARRAAAQWRSPTRRR